MGVLTSHSPRIVTPRFTTITDSFNRADSTTTMGSTDTGQTWTPLSGTWGIISNTGYKVVTSGNQEHTVIDATVSDCTITLIVTTVDSGGIAFRAIDDNNLFLLDSGGGNIYRRTAGSFTIVASPGGEANGDTESVVLSGTSIVYKVNGGTPRASFTDSQGTTATKHGIRAFGNILRVDNLSITVP